MLNFLIGLASGYLLCFITMLVIYVRASKNVKKKAGTESVADRTTKLLNQAELIGSVKYRFKLITKLTEEQQNLVSRLEGPSSGPAFSKHRNSVYAQVNDLERQKSEIMETILEDGLDPKISMVTPEGETVDVKLSEYLAIRKSKEDNKNLAPNKPVSKVVKKEENVVRLKRKLKLVENKDND